MKFKTFLFVIFSLSFLEEPQDKALTIDYLNTVDVIAILKADSQYKQKEYVLQVQKVFKGILKEEVLVNMANYTIAIDETYLMFLKYARNSQPPKLWIDEYSRIKVLTSASADIEFLINNIKCFDESRKGTLEFACTREYTYLCGCDGKEYHNSCDAYKEGLNIYTFGKCAQHK